MVFDSVGPGTVMNENTTTIAAQRATRSGVPFTMYFSAEQSQALATIARDRRVSKATLVRFAVERLLEQIESGEFNFPLGV